MSHCTSRRCRPSQPSERLTRNPPQLTHVDITPERSELTNAGAAHLREQVRRALEAALVAGELQPGSLYSAPALGERLGVSATPVREAMLELSKDGLVVTEPSRGYRVVKVSEKDLAHISEIRLLLEGPSTVMVAKIITPGSLDRLAELADEIVAAASDGDLIGYLDFDRRFHVQLISELGNSRLTEVVERLSRQAGLCGLDQLVDSGRLLESALEHHALIDAMRVRDHVATEKLITSHIKQIRRLPVEGAYN
jgi:DNA-binding GntR family transcriptional regulator